MKKKIISFSLLFVSLFAFARPQLFEETNKPLVDYKVGEPIVFTFTVVDNETNTPSLYLRWTSHGDDGVFDAGFNPISTSKPVKVTTKLSKPGFLRLTASLVDANGRQYGRVHNLGAGADVKDILPSYEEPSDFDEYWKGELKKLRAVPIMVMLKKTDEKFIPAKFPKGFDVYDVSIGCIGRPVTGRMAIPINAAPASLKAQINFEGYGPGMQNGEVPSWLCQADKIVFTINAHGYEIGKDDQYYKDFFKKYPNYGFIDSENADRDKTYFHDMALRVVRAFDYIKKRPEWNGKDLIAYGGSQGGLQASWAGSLVKGLTECKPSVTWCCDLRGSEVGRPGGWRPAYKAGLGYYDAIFHTRRIPKSCRLEIRRVGVGDSVCPASGLAAQYNVASCPKSVAWYQNSTHMDVPEKPVIVTWEEPAAPGVEGVATKEVSSLKKIDFVNAEFLTNGWTIVEKDGVEKEIDFAGRKNLRGQMPVLSNVTLKGTIVAEESGYALLGVGADWWWVCSVNGKEIYGRTHSTPGANGKASFEKDDWVFRIPVKCGENEVSLDVCLGEHGVVAMELLDSPTYAEKEISKKLYDDFKFFQKEFPTPNASPRLKWSGRNGARKCKFETDQPYPAGIEWREASEDKWKSVWDDDCDDDHKVVLPFEDGKSYELRVVQHALQDGWNIIKGDIVRYPAE